MHHSGVGADKTEKSQQRMCWWDMHSVNQNLALNNIYEVMSSKVCEVLEQEHKCSYTGGQVTRTLVVRTQVGRTESPGPESDRTELDGTGSPGSEWAGSESGKARF